MKNTANALKIARHANNMTIETASSRSGVSRSYLNEIERGLKTFPSNQIIEKLAKAYGLQLFQIKELSAFYKSLNMEEERKFRLTLMKTLEMIENNYIEATN